jgi:hypothetical protein
MHSGVFYDEEKRKKVKKETLLDQLIYKNTIELMEFENKYKVEIQKAIDIIENKIQIALLHKDDVLDINEYEVYPKKKRFLLGISDIFKTEKYQSLFDAVILKYFNDNNINTQKELSYFTISLRRK